MNSTAGNLKRRVLSWSREGKGGEVGGRDVRSRVVLPQAPPVRSSCIGSTKFHVQYSKSDGNVACDE